MTIEHRGLIPHASLSLSLSLSRLSTDRNAERFCKVLCHLCPATVAPSTPPPSPDCDDASGACPILVMNDREGCVNLNTRFLCRASCDNVRLLCSVPLHVRRMHARWLSPGRFATGNLYISTKSRPGKRGREGGSWHWGGGLSRSVGTHMPAPHVSRWAPSLHSLARPSPGLIHM